MLRLHPSRRSALTLGKEKAAGRGGGDKPSWDFEFRRPSCLFPVAKREDQQMAKRTTGWENQWEEKEKARKREKSVRNKHKRNAYVREPIVLTSDLRTQVELNTFQNTINPSRNKEKSFPKERLQPGLLTSHYSVNRKAHLPQSSETLPSRLSSSLSVTSPSLIFLRVSLQ